MEILQEESRTFKASKMLNRKRFENPFAHDENEKHVSNPEEVYTFNVISLRKVLNHYLVYWATEKAR